VISLTFHKKTNNSDGSVTYQCCKCRELGKTRAVTVRDGRIVGKKNPEIDHHSDCRPIESHHITIRDMTGKMLTNVRDHHMTPRDAYNFDIYSDFCCLHFGLPFFFSALVYGIFNPAMGVFYSGSVHLWTKRVKLTQGFRFFEDHHQY
jgi:hypothetical protein